VREFFPYGLRLEGRDLLIVWFDGGDEPDGVLVDDDGRVIVQANMAALRDYARAERIRIDTAGTEDVWALDLDSVAFWTIVADEASVDCIELLNAWNLFVDLAHSVGTEFDDRGEIRDQIYDKLFWGNNLPAMTPEGESFEPTWSDEELVVLRDTMTRGLEIARRHLVPS
jgi:hypothetical protein